MMKTIVISDGDDVITVLQVEDLNPTSEALRKALLFYYNEPLLSVDIAPSNSEGEIVVELEHSVVRLHYAVTAFLKDAPSG